MASDGDERSWPNDCTCHARMAMLLMCQTLTPNERDPISRLPIQARGAPPKSDAESVQ
jgi:hypothetical protein